MERGDITFVAHSLGGLVVKQTLRAAANVVNSDPFARSLISRTRRILFLGTPHAGSGYASIFSLDLIGFFRRSAVLKDLEANNPNLRELNFWFREFERDEGIQTVVLTEQLPLKVLGLFRLPARIGLIVPPSSADPGTGGRVVPVDADHFELCKPQSRESQIYRQILDLIRTPSSSSGRFALDLRRNDIDLVAQNLQESASRVESALDGLNQSLAANASLSFDRANTDTQILVDKLASDEISRLERIRFLPEVEVEQEARQLARELENGKYAAARGTTRARGFALCARQLSRADMSVARRCLSLADQFGNGEESRIAAAVLEAASGNLDGAIANLGRIGDKEARSVQLILSAIYLGEKEALTWLTKAALSASDLDADGKYALILALMNSEQWSDAEKVLDGISSEELNRNFGLHWLCGGIELALSISVVELRPIAVATAPFIGADFPFDGGEAALAHRRKASDLYKGLAQIASEFRCPRQALLARERVFWLSLLDPVQTSQARTELAQTLRDRPLELRHLALALQMGLKVDLAEAGKEIDRQLALNGRGNSDIALARCTLALVQPTAEAGADYLALHRDELEVYIDGDGVARLEILLLASAGRVERAKERLAAIDRSTYPAREYAKLEQVIAEAEGNDPLEQSLKAYQQTNHIQDLTRVVDLLAGRRYWTDLLPYAEELFKRTGALPDAEKFGIALYNTRLEGELEVFLSEHESLVNNSTQLRQLHAWSIYHQGNLLEAKRLVAALREQADNESLRILAVRIDIGTGDWESLASFVEGEWQARGSRTPIELLRAAQLASQLRSGRTKELVLAAADAGPEDPGVLVTCYDIAVKSGWEGDPTTFQWMQRALQLSNPDDGPVQSMSLDEILDRQPGWLEHQKTMFTLLAQAKLPISMVAKAINQPLINLFALTAIANRSESDPRKRTPIPAYSGNRLPQQISPNRIGLEATSLLTLELLGASEIVFDNFSEIVIPHQTLPWLFEQQGRISFHQPSRVKDAHALRDLVAEGAIAIVTVSELPPDALIREVGESMASLLAQAKADKASDVTSFVVHSFPVYALGSLMKTEANLDAYAGLICGTSSLIQALSNQGAIDATEARELHARVSAIEKPWPESVELTPRARLYLDGSLLSTLQHLNLLPRLAQAGFKLHICKEDLDEAGALIRYGSLAEQGQSLITSIRHRLRRAISNGRVSIHGSFRETLTSEEDELNPTSAVFGLTQIVDAIISDDRFMNQYPMIGESSTPILTTINLIDVLLRANVIDEAQRLAWRSALRAFGMIMVPIEAAELVALLSHCRLVDGRLVETHEVKAIRENLRIIQRTDYVQAPGELIFMNGLDESFRQAIRVLWQSNDDVDLVRAKCSWLAQFIDARSWAHCLGLEAGQVMAAYRAQIMALAMIAVGLPTNRKDQFQAWFDDVIFQPIAKTDVQSLKALVEQAAQLVGGAVEKLRGTHE